MINKTQEVKEILNNAQIELKTIQQELHSPVSFNTSLNRLERWYGRTKEKLSLYLVKDELDKYAITMEVQIATIKDIFNTKNTGGSPSVDKSLFDFLVKNFTEYCIELIDDLDNYPENILSDIYNVFISYAWANDDIVLAIDQWLRNKGIKTRIDKRDFFAGSRIRDEIMRVMSECKVILIFHSQQSKDKPWIQFERELAADIEMSSKNDGKEPPRIIYVVIDNTSLPNLTEKNRIAITAKGKRFDSVCDEIYQNILQLPRVSPDIDLSKWSGFTF